MEHADPRDVPVSGQGWRRKDVAVRGPRVPRQEEPEDDRKLRRELRAQLDAIREEEVPEQLLDLARRLQAKLRRGQEQ